MKSLRQYILHSLLMLIVAGGFASISAQPRREVQAIGCYIGKSADGNKPGYSVPLWSWNSQIIGLIEYRHNRPGEQRPQGLLTEVQYDSGTGRISFETKMTTGVHSCPKHRKVPSHDLLSFRGVLKEDRLEGDLVLWDQLDAPPVALDRHPGFVLPLDESCRPMTFEAYEVWHWFLNPEYQSRGPKW